MADFNDLFGFDDKLSKGKWFDICGMKVKLAYSDSPEIEAKAEQERNDLTEKLGRELTIEELTEVGNKVFSENVIIDWEEGLTIKGEPFPCTNENKSIALKNPKFTKNCILISRNNQMFQQKRIDEKTKK